MFLEQKISYEVVNKIENIIDENRVKLDDCSHLTTTENGFQTFNIIDLFDKNLRKQILNGNNLYKDMFHIHYLEYGKNGSQREHDHSKTEFYSFILYLNDAIGNTIFKNKVISPEKGLLIIFDADLKHKSLNCYNKKILVGAIKQRKSNES